jgi:hypothetical protein
VREENRDRERQETKEKKREREKMRERERKREEEREKDKLAVDKNFCFKTFLTFPACTEQPSHYSFKTENRIKKKKNFKNIENNK